MFGLVQDKWFGFIAKQPKQPHPQLVHWWVLGHISLFSIFFYIIFSFIFISFGQLLFFYKKISLSFHSFFFFFQISIFNPKFSFQSKFSASSFLFLFFKAYLRNGSHYCEKGSTNLDVILLALGNCAFFKSWLCNSLHNNDPLIGSLFLPFLCAILSRKKYLSCL